MERYQSISRAFRQAPWRSQLQTAAAALLVLVAVTAIGGMSLASASRWATAGRAVQNLEARKIELQIQNGELQKQLAQLRSMGRLEARAMELGFAPATNTQVEYLVVTGYPGKGARPATELAGAAPGASPRFEVRYDETLVDWVARALSSMTAEAAGEG